MRVSPCPSQSPVGFYWYRGNYRCLGRIPQWLHRILENALPVMLDIAEGSDRVEDGDDHVDSTDGEQEDP